jgi:hypothetical protein
MIPLRTLGDIEIDLSIPRYNDYDVIKSGKLECRQAVTSHKKVEIGIVDGKIYSRLIIPIGKRPKRFDCSKLYDLVIKELELRLLRSYDAKELTQ